MARHKIYYDCRKKVNGLVCSKICENEKGSAQRGFSGLTLTDVPGVLMEYKFEKDACLITVHPKDTK